jgi:hypothetical protein
MKKLSLIFVCLFTFLFLDHLAAHEHCADLSENYVYDHHGNPLFVKVYVTRYDEEASNSNKPSPALKFIKKNHFFSQMLQKDRHGRFLAVPLQKKKNKNKDEDDDNPYQEQSWICPYCDTYNDQSRNVCSNKSCP